MPRFAANISLMYTEVPFLERFGAAARDGFRAVECLFPYEHPIATLAAQLHAAKLDVILINTPPGNWHAGERGLAAQPGREADFRRAFAQALEYAVTLECPQIHVMAGLVAPTADRIAMRRTFLDNLRYAAHAAAAHGVHCLIEPINTRDIPGYFLNRQDAAHEIRAELGLPNLLVQMDLYHCQIVEGDLAMKIRKYLGGVGHIQIAGVPERHEPDHGEINYPYLFALLDELGYPGWVSGEYRPKAGTSQGLGWLKPWL